VASQHTELCDAETQTEIGLLWDEKLLRELIDSERRESCADPMSLSDNDNEETIFGSDFDVSEGELERASVRDDNEDDNEASDDAAEEEQSIGSKDA
jgi:hypothetical protein